MGTFDTLVAFKASLQRKPLKGAVLLAPYSATAIAALTTGASQSASTLAAMTGHLTVGKLTTDGLTLSDSVTKQEDRGWGDNYPSRIDVESETASMNFTAMESRKATFENYYGVDMTSVLADHTTGEVKVDKPTVPVLNYKRALALFEDDNKDGTGKIWWAVYFLRALVSANGDQTFQKASPGLTYPMTAEATGDDVAGTAVRLFWGGPGLASLLTDMGISLAP